MEMKIKSSIFAAIICICLAMTCHSQNHYIDSVLRILPGMKNDTAKIITLQNLSSEYKIVGDGKRSEYYLDQAEELIKDLISQSSGSNVNYLKKLWGHVIIGKSIIYQDKGDYPKTLEYIYKALKLFEEINFKNGIAHAYINIGNVFYFQKDFDKAMIFYEKSYGVYELMKDTNGMAGILGNIGVISKLQKKYDLAIEKYSQSYEFFRLTNNKKGMAHQLNNIAGLFYKKGEYKKCLEYSMRSLQIKKEIGDKFGVASSLGNIGELYASQGDYELGEKYFLEALQMVKEVGDLEGVSSMNLSLSELYEQKKDFKASLSYYKDFVRAKDSLLNEENTKKTVRLEMNYEFDKKEAAAKLEQEKKEVVNAAEKRKHQIIIWCIGGVLCMVSGFAIFVYRSFKQKQKANVEISKQKHIIEEKQKEILDSIHYARRIQTALITSEKYIHRNLNKLNRNS
ncbi:MAG: protein serine/threonine phosphatase [Bacteroidetes bacterium]|jgi:tetratricopeptide (TPR) repeat protein|nr:protein serine/threonine phosphatase [Bacteroidota bacterium]